MPIAVVIILVSGMPLEDIDSIKYINCSPHWITKAIFSFKKPFLFWGYYFNFAECCVALLCPIYSLFVSDAVKKYLKHGKNLYDTVFCTTVIAPLLEEIYNRIIVRNIILKDALCTRLATCFKTVSENRAITCCLDFVRAHRDTISALISALLFSLIHLDAYYIIPYLVLFTFIRFMSGMMLSRIHDKHSIFHAMSIHGLHNFIAISVKERDRLS